MKAKLFDFELPTEAIAQTPAQQRDASRLLVIDRQTGQVQDLLFRDLPDILPGPVTFIRNNARVLKARLPGRRSGGGKVECLLLNPAEDGDEWWCLLRPGKRLPAGSTFHWPDAYEARVVAKDADGKARVRFSCATGDDLLSLSERIGDVPLPPYIERAADDPRRHLDAERYQTVYAAPDQPVAVAAPTAGLHFTAEMLEHLTQQGHSFADLTLHVGLGTFRPIQTETLEEHPMHEEIYQIPAATLRQLRSDRPGIKLAVGTTSLRTVEDLARKGRLDSVPPDAGIRDSADLFIYPPAEFHTQALLTNFHLPRSTLICLVAAFLTPGSTDGIEWVRQIYQSALALDYRFYSYGDAMLIL